MFSRYLFIIILIFCAYHSTYAQCGPNESKVTLQITPDFYFDEVSWTLTDPGYALQYVGSLQSNDPQEFTYCVSNIQCSIFEIHDLLGDGIYPDGHYSLLVNDTLVYENPNGQYGSGEKVYLNCQPGTFCSEAFPIDTGHFSAPSKAEIWYKFTPPANGAYTLSTCDTSNHCPSKIWVYNTCINIAVTNNQAGTIFYAEDGCVHGASASLYLAAGSEYYFRLAYVDSTCAQAPLAIDFHYQGPIVGCTDPNACNYNPLATVTDTCYYPGNPLCPEAPDLVILQDELRGTTSLSLIENGDQCAVDEGCLRGVGPRWIINFSTHIKNIGDLDYFIGEPPADIHTPSNQFLWDPCHMHWHYRGYAEYLLYTSEGKRVPIGTKNGFCVLDLECNDGGAGKYTCIDMGISAHCGDIYSAGLPCQWIDITDIPPGSYTMVTRVNWDKSPDKLGRYEKSYDNNWAQACFNLSYDGDEPVVEFLEDDCPLYYDCSGEIFGSGEVDCNGICKGVALQGDLNADTLRDQDDLDLYLQRALSEGSPATECSDLFANDTIDLYDAALLQECMLHGADPTYWGLGFACQFPKGFENPNDLVHIRLANLDTLEKTVDLQMLNPFNPVLGFEFRVTGLTINSIDNLMPAFHGSTQFNASGKIVSLAKDESTIPKSSTAKSIARIHYGTLNLSSICLKETVTAVNNKYQRCATSVDTCLSSGAVGLHPIASPNFEVYAQPNPFTQKCSLFFENASAEPIHITLSDMRGKVVRNFEGIREESVTFERGNLPAGAYFYCIRKSGATVLGKLIAF